MLARSVIDIGSTDVLSTAQVALKYSIEGEMLSRMHTLALVPDEPDVGNRRRNALNILASTSSRNLAVHQS